MHIVVILFIWRLYLFFTAYISQTLSEFTPSFPYSDVYLIPTTLPQWVWGFANFDGVHYISIAKNGYSAQYTQTFFPLYPLIIRFIGNLLPDINYIITGLVLSFLFFYFSLQVFVKLFNIDYPRKLNFWLVISVLVFPTSFFYVSFYTESLFFLLSLLSFYFIRQKNWFYGALCGGLASLTRITGIALYPAYIYEWYITKKQNSFNKNVVNLLSGNFILLGLFTYMWYLHVEFNDAFYFWHAQEVFGAERVSNAIVLPPQVLWRYIKLIISLPIETYSFWKAFIELVSFIIGFIYLLLAHKFKVRMSYLIYGWIVFLLPILTGTFSSLPRYLLIIFPIFIVMSVIKHKKIKIYLMIVYGILQMIFTYNFIRGLWVA